MIDRSGTPTTHALPARLAVAFACASGLAFAGVGSAADMNLGAGDCAPAGSATAAITNACLSNTGTITLFASYRPPVTLGQFEAIEAGVDIFTAPATLSPWWHLEASPVPGCRGGKISVNVNFTSGPSTCSDFWNGQAMTGWDYSVNQAGFGPNTARLRVVVGVQDGMGGPVSPSVEYYGFEVVIQKSQSTGPGSCSGCTDRACFSLAYMSLEQPAPIPDNLITKGTQTVVTYNGGTGGPNCAAAITQKGSWGAIKAIYR